MTKWKTANLVTLQPGGKVRGPLVLTFIAHKHAVRVVGPSGPLLAIRGDSFSGQFFVDDDHEITAEVHNDGMNAICSWFVP